MAVELSIEKIGSSFHDEFTLLLQRAFDDSLNSAPNISDRVLTMRGLSGKRYRTFINNLVRSIANPRYLEVGSWTGSTACAAMEGNALTVLCIDNWSEFGGPKAEFFANIEAVRNERVRFTFLEQDFRDVAVAEIEKYNIYLYDGPHEEADQFDGLSLYEGALDDDLFFIVDDWNWPQVRNGTMNALRQTGYTIDFAIIVRTSQNDQHAEIGGEYSDWHNGYFLSKLSRRPR